MTDIEEIRPTIEMVADLVRVRVVTEGGDTVPIRTFDDTTWPTSEDVDRIITQATDFVLPQLPDSVSESWAPAGAHLVALYSAILVEASYFREQLTDDMVRLYYDLLQAGIRGLGFQVGNSGTTGPGAEAPGHKSGPVDSIIQRSVMTDPLELQYRMGIPEIVE